MPSEANTHPGSALADGPPEPHIVNGDVVPPSDTLTQTEHSVTMGDCDNGTTANSIESKVNILNDNTLHLLYSSVATSLAPCLLTQLDLVQILLATFTSAMLSPDHDLPLPSNSTDKCRINQCPSVLGIFT